MTNYNKKIVFFYIYFFLFAFDIHTTPDLESTIPFHQNFVWEKYSALPLFIATTALSLYGISYDRSIDSQYILTDPNRELKNFINNLHIIYPHKKNDEYLQAFTDNIKIPIIMIDEAYIQYNENCLNYLFGKAYELKPCCVYIVKNTTNKTCPSFAAKESFIFNLKLLQNIDKDIIILGTSKNKFFQSSQDICSLGFNLKTNNPSYEERLEFLEFLFQKSNLLITHRDVSYFAKKTLGFSYIHLSQLINYIQSLQKSNVMNQSFFEKSLHSIIENYKICQVTPEDFYNTCVHETGHAIMIALLESNNFMLHHASATPHGYDSCQYLGKTAFTKNSFSSSCIFIDKEVQDKNKIINYEHIKILFAGKIAEQIIFGLSNKLPLKHQSAFEDFIKNPEGATDDLYEAIDLLNAHNSYLQLQPIYNQYYYKRILSQSSLFYEDLYNLYGETLNVLLPLKDKIIEIAQLLEQKEVLVGSEIYKKIKNK